MYTWNQVIILSQPPLYKCQLHIPPLPSSTLVDRHDRINIPEVLPISVLWMSLEPIIYLNQLFLKIICVTFRFQMTKSHCNQQPLCNCISIYSGSHPELERGKEEARRRAQKVHDIKVGGGVKQVRVS